MHSIYYNKIKTMRKHIIGMLLLIHSFIGLAQISETINLTPPGYSGDFLHIEYIENKGLVAIADNGYFYISNDTAKTWEIEKTPISVIGMDVIENNSIGYIFSSKEIYKTTNAMQTWEKLALHGFPNTLNGYDLTITNVLIKNKDTLFIIARNLENGLKIYLSADKGENFELVAQNMNSTNIFNSISSMHWETALHGFLYGTGYYAETFDGGNTWEKYLLSNNSEKIRHVYSFENGKALLDYENSDYNMHTFYISNDGNMHNEAYTYIANSVYPTIGFTYFTNGIIYTADTQGAFYTSTDSAKTWNKSIIATSSFGSIASKGGYFFNSQVGVVVGRNLTSYVTTDGGETWNKYVHGGAEGFNKIYCKNEQECFITGQTGRLFRTQDGGTTWTYKDLHNGSLHEIEFPTADTGYIVGPSVLYRTIDGGDTWTGLPHIVSKADIMEFPTKDVGYIGYPQGGFEFYKTEDAGSTLTRRAGMTYLTNKTRGGGSSLSH